MLPNDQTTRPQLTFSIIRKKKREGRKKERHELAIPYDTRLVEKYTY